MCGHSFMLHSKESEDKLRKGSKVKGTKLQFILEISKHLVSKDMISVHLLCLSPAVSPLLSISTRC